MNLSKISIWLPLIYFIISDAIFPPANLHGAYGPVISLSNTSFERNENSIAMWYKSEGYEKDIPSTKIIFLRNFNDS